MKKTVVLFCFIVIYLASFAVNVYAQVAEGVWQFPRAIKTYIQPGHRNTERMKRAFAEWTRKTNQKIIFKYVSSKNVADIRVTFVKKIDNANSHELDRAIGLARVYSNGSKTRIRKADIYIADLTQDGRTLSNDEVYTTMLHEIGHALGLNHVTQQESIMYPMADVRLEISKYDIKQLYDRYGW